VDLRRKCGEPCLDIVNLRPQLEVENLFERKHMWQKNVKLAESQPLHMISLPEIADLTRHHHWRKIIADLRPIWGVFSR
jgi:hypothetical protein